MGRSRLSKTAISSPFWGIDEGIEDAAHFFRVLDEVLPDATRMYVEAGRVAADVRTVYERFRVAEPYLPGRHTIWPRGRLYSLRVEGGLFLSLAEAAQSHAGPEVADHLTVYAEANALLEWHDAFCNGLVVADSVDEARVSRLASKFGCGYAMEWPRSPKPRG